MTDKELMANSHNLIPQDGAIGSSLSSYEARSEAKYNPKVDKATSRHNLKQLADTI